jgi:hypothetical protein
MMFEAWVIVCIMYQGKDACFPAQDTRGPYATHEECYERTVEMSADIMTGIPLHIPVGWKCTPPGTAT